MRPKYGCAAGVVRRRDVWYIRCALRAGGQLD